MRPRGGRRDHSWQPIEAASQIDHLVTEISCTGLFMVRPDDPAVDGRMALCQVSEGEGVGFVEAQVTASAMGRAPAGSVRVRHTDRGRPDAVKRGHPDERFDTALFANSERRRWPSMIGRPQADGVRSLVRSPTSLMSSTETAPRVNTRSIR